MSRILNILVVLILNAVWILAKQATIFKNVPSCSEKDQNINECLKVAFQEMAPSAKNGIPELNIPPMDPFFINKTSYAFSHSLIEGKITLINLKIYGAASTIFNNVDYKRKGNHIKLTMKAKIPKLFFEGTYKAKVRFNAARISSKGPFNLTTTDVDLKVTPEGELYERDGHVYFRLMKYDLDPTFGNLIFAAEGLMPDPLLNDAIIEFINQNWRGLYKTIIPETRAAWEPELVKLGNEYFEHIPMDAIISQN